MDWEAFLAAANCDCLGCLMEMERLGEVGPDWVQEIIAEQNAALKMHTVTCANPTCGKQAYVSMYEPDVAHCPGCGLYSHLDPISYEWMPFRQGTPMHTLEEAIAKRRIHERIQQQQQRKVTETHGPDDSDHTDDPGAAAGTSVQQPV